MSAKPPSSMSMANWNFPFTTSRLATGSSAENTISFASRALWKLWKSPSVMKNTPQRIGYPGISVMKPKAMNR